MSVDDVLAFLTTNHISYEYLGAEQLEVNQVADLSKAGLTNISFFNDPKRKAQLSSSQAGMVILKAEFANLTTCNKLIVANPYYVYSRIAQFLNPVPFISGIHPTAVVDETADISINCSIGAHVYIGPRVTLAEHVSIGAGCVIEADVVIGANTYLAPNVTVMHDCEIGHDVILNSGCVIGGDGFGWAPNAGVWSRIPQIGRVIIGNHVSIGNNSTVDRGALQDTVIADHCIIDNLVQIAHNITIGQGTAIAAQVGISGSTHIGKNCILAGQVGIAGHIKIADGTVLMAKAGVTHTLKEAGSYSGFPAIPTLEWQKNTVRAKNLNKMAQQIKLLEQELNILKKQLEEA